MKNSQSSKNIVDYWNGVERFTPRLIDTKTTSEYVHSIQKEVLCDYDLPWKHKERFRHHDEPNKTWVYTIFLGVIDYSDITRIIQAMLVNNEIDYGLEKTTGVSCLCRFQLNSKGQIIQDTFSIPEYFISISCLNHKTNHPRNWLDLGDKIRHKIIDAYQNWVDVLGSRAARTVEFEDLSTILSDIIKVSMVDYFYDRIRNKAIIYSSHINIPPPPQDPSYSTKESESEEDFLKRISAVDSNIINSFYLEDIKIVSNALANNQKQPVQKIGIGLHDYLGLIPKHKKHDLREDKSELEKLSSPNMMPHSRWPVSNNISLSIAQQVGVNLALVEKRGLFSVNGPPGTGKSTLLRDIISEVITNRAKILSGFKNPNDAFKDPEILSIDRYKYKVWHLDERLLGHEIVIASSNNNAVENISKEIPRLSEIDKNYGLEYFSEIANYMNDEPSWGIASAVLGNKANRSNFFDKFWNKYPGKNKKDEIDNNYGLDYLLNTIKPKSNWEDAKKEFLLSLKEFDSFQSELIKLQKIFKNKDSLINKKDSSFHEISKINHQIEICIDQIKLHEDECTNITRIVEQKKFQLNEMKKLEPKWYVVFIDFFTKSSSYKKWSEKCSDIIIGIDALFDKYEKLRTLLLELQKDKSRYKYNVSILMREIEELTKESKESEEYINFMRTKYSWISEFPDKNFWESRDQEIQLSSPWMHTDLADTRAKVFVCAIKLHYSFIVNSSDKITNNIKSMKKVMTSGEWPSQSQNLLKYIWSSFFLVVPVVSTTFASLGKLFKGLDEPESLGWLLIDEAGQSAPQEALGAIYRSKKTIVVGDPLQVHPIVTIPNAINDILLEYYSVSRDWSVKEESVQTLSDRVNTYGTNIITGFISQWVGSPLRVHRRCLEPMFSIANKIAYDNMMIQATEYKISSFETIYSNELYKDSQWIDVQRSRFEGHASIEEGAEVLKMIHIMIDTYNSMPNLYIISPFRSVSDNIKSLLRNDRKLKTLRSKELYSWIKKSVGTIHRFQGKQADAVILVLGGNPDMPVAIDWASKGPNILNVAVTRAKYKLFVVGNYKVWSSKPYFSDLATVINVRSV